MPDYPDSDRALDGALTASTEAGTTLRQTLTLHRDWLPVPDTVTLEPSYRLVRERSEPRILARLGAHEVYLDEPVRLMPVTVPKPWGHEQWLTGIEARGESGVVTNAGVLPLSQYLALAPRRLAGGAAPVLLKLLDPRPEPLLGELYFEAHEKKHEVYVVSAVDCGAWPEGRGAIRYGMNQALRRRYGDDDAFRRDYLAAVKRYEAVRRALDGGADPSAAQETEHREAMEAFTGLRTLGVGDVVVVPTWLPHALLHGVRVIEFQTPSYERYILSFPQQVLTQDHWDTEAVVGRIRLDVPDPDDLEAVADHAQRIAAFDDFGVWRIALEPGAAFTVPAHLSYGLCMVVDGRVELGPLTLGAEEAAWVPAAALSTGHGCRARIESSGTSPAVVLLAAPEL